MESGQQGVLNEESKSKDVMKRYAEKTFGFLQNEEMKERSPGKSESLYSIFCQIKRHKCFQKDVVVV